MNWYQNIKDLVIKPQPGAAGQQPRHLDKRTPRPETSEISIFRNVKKPLTAASSPNALRAAYPRVTKNLSNLSIETSGPVHNFPASSAFSSKLSLKNPAASKEATHSGFMRLKEINPTIRSGTGHIQMRRFKPG